MPWGSMMHLLLNFNLLFMFQNQKMLEEKQARKKEKEVEKMEKEKRLQKLKSQVLILQFSSIYKTILLPLFIVEKRLNISFQHKMLVTNC